MKQFASSFVLSLALAVLLSACDGSAEIDTDIVAGIDTTTDEVATQLLTIKF